MIVNFVREFYAKCNRTVVHTSSMPLLVSTQQSQNDINGWRRHLRDVLRGQTHARLRMSSEIDTFPLGGFYGVDSTVWRTPDRPQRSFWTLLLAGAAFIYLWWLAALLFDLTFTWHRYVRHAVWQKYLRQARSHRIERERRLRSRSGSVVTEDCERD